MNEDGSAPACPIRSGRSASRRTMTPGWGRFPDGAEVISLYDTGDEGFGDAVNLACDWCSEWGYALFGA